MVWKISRQHGPGLHGKVLDGPADSEPALVDRLDVGGIGVAEKDVVTGPDHVGADRAADGTGTDNR